MKYDVSGAIQPTHHSSNTSDQGTISSILGMTWPRLLHLLDKKDIRLRGAHLRAHASKRNVASCHDSTNERTSQ